MCDNVPSQIFKNKGVLEILLLGYNGAIQNYGGGGYIELSKIQSIFRFWNFCSFELPLERNIIEYIHF